VSTYKVTFNFMGIRTEVVEAVSPEEAWQKASQGMLVDDEVISVEEEEG
jgi:hypothetical protein